MNKCRAFKCEHPRPCCEKLPNFDSSKVVDIYPQASQTPGLLGRKFVTTNFLLITLD